MSDLHRKLIAAALSATVLAGMAFAQDTATPTPTEPAAETPAAEGSVPKAPERSLGEDVVDPNAPGTIYVKETQGDWDIRCIRTETGNDPCQIFQGLKDEQGTVVAEVTMVALENAGDAVAGATVTTPLGTLLTEQVVIAIDAAAGKRYPFTWCDQEGCHARLGFNNEGLTGLKKGGGATVSVVPLLTPDQPVKLAMSLKGFTAAFTNMQALNDAAAAAQAAAQPAPDAAPAEGEKPASGN